MKQRARQRLVIEQHPPDSFPDDPVEFAKEVCGLELWEKQREIARAVVSHPRVSARSGHKIGKSDDAAVIALWFVSDPVRRPGARVIMTSASARQVKSILWKSVKRCYNNAKKRGRPIGGVLHKNPDNGLQFEDGREILGFTCKEGESERFAGFSGKWLLFILDEASGIPNDIFTVIEGNRAGGARTLYLSNPTRTSGEFYDSHNSKAKHYYTVHVSSRETPNAKTGQELIPGLATKEWCDEKLEEWGPDDPRYLVRVLGEFPPESPSGVIPKLYLDEAEKRDNEGKGELLFGLDVARFGDDDPILCARRGDKVFPLVKLPRGNGPTLAGFAREQARKIATRLGYDEDYILQINVDAIGLGVAVYDSLCGYKDINAVAVNVAEEATDPKEYFNCRTELYFKARKWLKTGEIPKDQKLRDELLAHDYDFAPSTQACRVEPKEKIKKKIQTSPDRADAFVLTFYEGPNVTFTKQRVKRKNTR